jgi:hypothetical protein
MVAVFVSRQSSVTPISSSSFDDLSYALGLHSYEHSNPRNL